MQMRLGESLEMPDAIWAVPVSLKNSENRVIFFESGGNLTENRQDPSNTGVFELACMVLHWVVWCAQRDAGVASASACKQGFR